MKRSTLSKLEYARTGHRQLDCSRAKAENLDVLLDVGLGR